MGRIGVITIMRFVCAGTPSDQSAILGRQKPGAKRRAFIFAMEPVQLDYTKLDGLVPAIVQDSATRDVLMVGFMNEEAFRRTRETGFVTFYSRTRQKLWTKGETSGNKLAVEEIRVDCDDDSLVVLARQTGGATCHLGYRSCFFRRVEADGVTKIPA